MRTTDADLQPIERARGWDLPPSVLGPNACWLWREHESAGRARRFLRNLLTGVADGEHVLEVGELLLSELVANAVEHAQAPRDRWIQVRCGVVAGHLLVEVDDAGRNMPVVRDVDEHHIRGRGLALVDALSVTWGCHPRECGIGKTVWALCSPPMPEVAQQAGGGDVRRAGLTNWPANC